MFLLVSIFHELFLLVDYIHNVKFHIRSLYLGLASMTVPIYVAEAAPPSVRGQVVTTYQLFITAGQFIASVMNGAFSYLEKDGWR